MNRRPLVTPPHIAVLILAAVLRFYRLSAQSLWADEGNSAMMATRNLARIARDAAADIHPPLYYWLLHFWAQLFGTSEAALRSLSAVLGVILVYVIYLTGRRLQSEQVGLAAALIAAINPFQIYYAQEARMYILLALWSGLALYALTLYVLNEGAGRMRPTPCHAALLLIALVGGLYTHYVFPVIIGAINVLYLLWLWDSRRREHVIERLAWWWGLHLIAGLLFLPWLPIALRQLGTWPSPNEQAGFRQMLGAALAMLSLGPVGYRDPRWPWNLAFAMGLLLGLWPRVRPARGRREHWLAWAIPFVGMAAPIVLMMARGLFTEAYLKFLIAGSPGFCLLLARGIIGSGEELAKLASPQTTQSSAATGSPRLPWLQLSWYGMAAALLGISAGTTLQAYYFNPAYARDDYRSIARHIEAVERPGDRIILEAPGQQEVFRYYYHGQLPIYPLPRQRPPDPQDLQRELERITATPGRIFAIFWAVEQADPDRIVENWLVRSAFKALDTWQGNVRFAIYTIPDFTASRGRMVAADQVFGDPPLLRLLRVGLGTDTIAAGEVLPLTLHWEAIRPIPERYKVTVQMLDERNQVIAQRDAEPAGGLYPTTSWTPGQPVEDSIGVLIRPGTPPGRYRLILAVYRAADGVRLPVTTQDPPADHVELGQVQIKRPATPPALITLGIQHSRRVRFGPLELLGFDAYKRGFGHAPDTPITPGDLLHVALYWRAVEAPERRLTMRLELDDGRSVVETDPVSPAYPTSEWEADEIVRGDHDLRIPIDLPPGRYPLFLRILDDGRPIGSRIRLQEIVIQSGA